MFVVSPLRRLSQLTNVARTFVTATALNMPIKEGDKLPAVTLTEGTPNDKVDLSTLFAGKKGILFAVPGAFTPGCSKTHLPGYVENFDKFKAKGIDVIACVSVNDPFVMDAWGKAHSADGKVRMLADAGGELARALDVELDAAAVLGNKRSKRYSMLVEDGVVKKFKLEPGPGNGLSCSLAPELLQDL